MSKKFRRKTLFWPNLTTNYVQVNMNVNFKLLISSRDDIEFWVCVGEFVFFDCVKKCKDGKIVKNVWKIMRRRPSRRECMCNIKNEYKMVILFVVIGAHHSENHVTQCNKNSRDKQIKTIPICCNRGGNFLFRFWTWIQIDCINAIVEFVWLSRANYVQ